MVAVAALLGLLGAAMTVGWWAWSEMADVPISAHGWVALGLGATFSIMLGVGLMVLVWRSHKRGYDDEAGRD
jgi:hypothetical protein